MTVLETKRLRLRKLVPADLEAMSRILDDADVMRYFGTKERQLEVTERMMGLYAAQGYGMYAVELKATGGFLGRIGFIVQHVEEHDEIELGWLVAREHWGRGYATEAARALLDYGFGWWKMPRIISLIQPENAGSIAVARKIGAAYERTVEMFGIANIHLYSVARPNST